MPDRSAENLRRLRAWDAEWDESKHNREDNGQFGIPRMRGVILHETTLPFP